MNEVHSEGKKRGWNSNCSALGAADTKTFSPLAWSRQQLSPSSFVCSPGNVQELLPLRALGIKAPSPSKRPLQDLGVITDSHLQQGWLTGQLLSGADIPYFLEGIGVCYHLVAGCDSAKLYMDHLLSQAAVGLTLLHVGLWAKLFVSLAGISMLSLPAELPKYHFISNERSALAMQRIHKDQASGSGKTPKRGGGKSLALSSLSWMIIIIIIIILLCFPSCPPACSGKDCIVHTKLSA